MKARVEGPRRLIPSLAVVLALSSCGGGGGGGGSSSAPPASVVVPPSPPPPPPPPIGSAFDTPEYRATAGAVSMNALAAYQHGATGAGVKVAVIDTGIDLQSTQFLGRVDPASAALAGNLTIDDVGGHGTGVAEILAAGRDGIGAHGIAFDATLIVFRTDIPGTCASGDCTHRLTAVAEAIDRARLAGARVINLSMIGGSNPTADMLAAVDRATAAGIVLAICAGNARDAVQVFAAGIALSPEARGQVVLVSFVNGSDNLLGPPAGAVAAHFMSARGDACSATTPMVAGALALLAQANPGLSGADLVSRLYASARDGGAPGQDAVYGRGIVDLTRAFP